MSKINYQCCGNCVFSDDLQDSEELVFCHVGCVKMNKNFPACNSYKDEDDLEEQSSIYR